MNLIQNDCSSWSDKLDFSMSWHSDKLKFEIAKDLKTLDWEMYILEIAILKNQRVGFYHVSSVAARFNHGIYGVWAVGPLQRRRNPLRSRAAEIKGCDFLALPIIPRRLAYSNLDHCELWSCFIVLFHTVKHYSISIWRKN